MDTLHAVPVAIRDVIEPNAVSMVGCIAAVAKEQDVLSFGRVAYGAWITFFFVGIGVLGLPLLDVELGHLLLILDIVRGNRGAYVRFHGSACFWMGNRIGWLTISSVVDAHRVEGVATDGACIRLLSP